MQLRELIKGMLREIVAEELNGAESSDVKAPPQRESRVATSKSRAAPSIDWSRVDQATKDDIVVVEPSAAPAKRGRKPASAVPAGMGPTLHDLRAALRTGSREGLAISQIAEEMGVEKKAVLKLIGEGLESKSITKSGERRLTRYFALP